jgi:hypothetical protein
VTDFSALGFDPAPGDVSQGEQMARRLRSATTALEQIKDVLAGTGDQQWEGRTADAFRGAMAEELRPRIERVYASFSEASRAVDRWVEALPGYQSRAAALAREADAAKADLASAQSTLSGLGDKPGDDATDAEREAYDRSKSSGESAVSSSQAALADVVRRANLLLGEASDSASTAARSVNSAREDAPDEPGLWDRITGALEGIGDFLGDVVEFIKDNWWDLLHQLVHITAQVLSIAAIFVPALAPFALGFAIADVVMSGIDWARGVPGAQEAFLTGALGLAGGAMLGQVFKGFMAAAGPALRNGPFNLAIAGGGSTGGAAVAALSYNPAYGPALGGWMVIQLHTAKGGADAVETLLGGNQYYSDSLARGWQQARRDDDE